jgi:hypothetical protein
MIGLSGSKLRNGEEGDSFDAPPLLSGQLWKNLAVVSFSLWALLLTALFGYIQYRVAKHEDEDAAFRERLTIVEQRQAIVLKHQDRLDDVDDRNARDHQDLRDAINALKANGGRR